MSWPTFPIFSSKGCRANSRRIVFFIGSAVEVYIVAGYRPSHNEKADGNLHAPQPPSARAQMTASLGLTPDFLADFPFPRNS
ncbi:MAG: hypothetical protein WCE61_05125 [Candidatus Acidiferrum sp.]